MGNIELYQKHLTLVSRSFAWCISKLEDDFRLWVSVSYLLFRILDTIEDSAWSSQSMQDQSFQDFIRFCETKKCNDGFESWLSQLPKSAPTSELLLAKDLPILLSDLEKIPPIISQNIAQNLVRMSRGMTALRDLSARGFTNIYQLNQYCFFVAGVVGELLSKIQNVREHGTCEISEQKLLQSHHFGLFLQKINILKDHLQDHSEGRNFAFSSQQILSSLMTDAKKSIQYITEIPKSFRDYRLFCATSFFLGIYSLPWIEKTWVTKIFEKIPRGLTEKLFEEIQSSIDDNEKLFELYQTHFLDLKIIREVSASTTSSSKSAGASNSAIASNFFRSSNSASANDTNSVDKNFEWFSNCYLGTLRPSHVLELGLLPG